MFAIQPRFGWPDDYVDIPSEEREARSRCGDDWCRLRDAAGGNERFFVRAVLPFRILGEERELCWGVWTEVSASTYGRVMELWHEPGQAAEPPLPGTLANELPDYPPTVGLPGAIHLRAPDVAPRFLLAPGLDHVLAAEQRSGVYPERALEWVSRFMH